MTSQGRSRNSYEAVRLRSLLREELGPFRRRFAWAGVYMSSVISLGLVGFRFLEGWGWFDALYMSVTTATSVGFMEVHPLSDRGRVFAMGLIVLGRLEQVETLRKYIK